MENKPNSKGVARISTENSALSAIKTAEDFDRIVSFVADSETYNRNFTVAVQEDGKTIRKVDRAAIATCLMLGSELGFKPMESIMLGRRLNDESVIQVYRGRDLGLSPIAAIENIHIWKDTNGKEHTYTGIHVIYKILAENNVLIDVIDDGTKPFPFYVDKTTNEIVEFDERIHIPVNTGLPISEIKDALEAKKIPVLRKYTRRGLVKLTRGKQEIAIPYTLLQAVDAGLYHGTNSYGEDVKGKNNWNSHPATHLVKMSVMSGARMIMGDVLQGAVYIADELPVNRTVEDAEHEELT